jgi:oligopeptide transport system ATP-binding protein
MVFQDSWASLNPRRTIVSQIIDAWQFHPELATGENRRDKAVALLEEVGIQASFADRLPARLSGGQRQRVNIARALAVDPLLLVLDEPVASLDVSIQAQILNLLARLQRERGLGFLLISHDLAVIRRMADHVAVMYLGKIVERGPTEEVVGAPRHPYTRALLSAARIGGTKQLSERLILSGEVPSATDPPSGCRFRTRCWKAQAVCAEREPARVGGHSRHVAYCNFPENTEPGASADSSEPPLVSRGPQT